MTTYKYSAMNPEGKRVKGQIQAVDEFAAAIQIKENCPIILSIEEVREKKAFLDSDILNMEIGSPRVKTRALALMCSQFAITLKSGMPLGRSMEIIGRQIQDKKLKKILHSASEDVQGGSTVADAFEKFRDAFPVTFLETIRAGEASGSLDSTFEKMQVYYENAATNGEKIRSALSYPIFVLVIAVVVLVVIMVKVIPTLGEVFADMGGELPVMTKMMIGAADFFSKKWLLLLAIVMILVIGWYLFTLTSHGKLVKGWLQLNMPVFGDIVRYNGAAQFATTMSTLLSSGLTINHAAEITSRVMDNYLLQKDVAGMIFDIEQGRSIGECMEKSEHFPQTLKDMCSVGEESGELAETLSTIGEYFTQETNRRMHDAVTLLEPTLMVVMALFAGFLVIAIYLPMFTMYDLF